MKYNRILNLYLLIILALIRSGCSSTFSTATPTPVTPTNTSKVSATPPSPTPPQVHIPEGFFRIGSLGFGYLNIPLDFSRSNEPGIDPEILMQYKSKDQTMTLSVMVYRKELAPTLDEFADNFIATAKSSGEPEITKSDATLEEKPAKLLEQTTPEGNKISLYLIEELFAYKYISIGYPPDKESIKKTIIESYRLGN